jgi:hypothetical protein
LKNSGKDFHMERLALPYPPIKWSVLLACFYLIAGQAVAAQIQIELRLLRLQYIAYEPAVANLVITNLAGRDIDLHDSDDQAWIDRANQLHIVYCAALRACAYARIGLNDLLSRASFAETKTRPRFVRSEEAEVKVAGGGMDTRIAQTNRDAAPKLFARPPNPPKDD